LPTDKLSKRTRRTSFAAVFVRVFFGGNSNAEQSAERHQPMNKSLEILKQQTAVAHYDNPWLEAADEAGSGFGKMLKFVKGEWLINEGIVPEGAEYIVFIDEVARGYIKFEDKTVTDRKIVKVRDGKAPSREELGDTDPTQWEVDERTGKPRDPWVLQWLLPMAR
jgi:hypothetical protein